MTVTGFPDWQPGGLALHGAIALANGTQNLTVIPSTQVPGTFPVYQTCYELYVASQNALPVGSASFLVVQMDWIDSASGLNLTRRKFKIVPGVNGTDHTVKIAGPVHADTVKISYSILSDSIHAITVVWRLFGTSRPYSRDVVRTTIMSTDGFTSSGAIPETGVLMNASPTVNAGLNAVRILPLYNGRVHIAGLTSSGVGDYQLSILEAFTSAPLMANDQVVALTNTSANGFFDLFVELPNIQCVAQLTNNNAANKVLQLAVSIDEVGV